MCKCNKKPDKKAPFWRFFYIPNVLLAISPIKKAIIETIVHMESISKNRL